MASAGEVSCRAGVRSAGWESTAGDALDRIHRCCAHQTAEIGVQGFC
jgi:hypothetical protein